MSNSIKVIAKSNRQHGISLVVSLIMLLIMTVIGISAMNTSISKLKMTTGIQQQSTASNSTEVSLESGIEEVKKIDASTTISNDDGDGIFDSRVSDIDIHDKSNWVNAFTETDGSEYIIEYLGSRPKEGDSEKEGAGSVMSYIYRITARSNPNNEKATRMFQRIYISDTGPATNNTGSASTLNSN